MGKLGRRSLEHGELLWVLQAVYQEPRIYRVLSRVALRSTIWVGFMSWEMTPAVDWQQISGPGF